MRVLLDTHAFLWWIVADARLSTLARDVIANKGNDVCFSVASAWEMAIKATLGHLTMPEDFGEFVTGQVLRNRFDVLSVLLHHALAVRSLPLLHRDPFDRLLVAQALTERLTIVTADEQIRRYGVETVW